MQDTTGRSDACVARKGSQPERERCLLFGKEDEAVLDRFVAVCALALRNAALFEKSQLENRRSEVLLELARCIFREQVDLHTLIYKIMMYAQNISRCERCQVLLIDDQPGASRSDAKMVSTACCYSYQLATYFACTVVQIATVTRSVHCTICRALVRTA